ncbi:MFS transporter [Ligilactobacillus sp. WILCCON 0076]|uniref:MFS transporter n=1 Tax=Ligilactobacillus ubinensis TaxID=2876789 RepID=A0A9X2FG71_9LACO|nr:MFS transporter [Ligilactobacillus ubinensis]MCP0885776.1 MFS transporter [Ligilactobacillus ubinensis]
MNTKGNLFTTFKKMKTLPLTSRQLEDYLLVVGGVTTIYLVIGVRDVLYEPFRSLLSVSNTQLGILLSVSGFVQIFGYLLFGWLLDSANVRKLFTIDLIGYASTGIFLACFHGLPFPVLVGAFILFGFFGDAIYWPVVQKAIKYLGGQHNQGKAFSIMGLFRSLGGTVVTAIDVFIFSLFTSALFGIKVAMIFNGTITILFAILIWFRMPDDFMADGRSDKEKKKKASLTSLVKVMKIPIVWTTGIASACIYVTSIGITTYYLPFLQHNYHVSASVVGAIGVVNGLAGMMIGPLSGIISDKYFKSSASWMSLSYAVLMFFLAGIIIMPKGNEYMYLGVAGLFLSTIGLIMVKAVYYAPLGEFGIDHNISATAMSLSSFLGYSPSFFAYPLIGKLLDSYPTQKAYHILFVCMLITSGIGLVINLYNSSVIKKIRQKNKV